MAVLNLARTSADVSSAKARSFDIIGSVSKLLHLEPILLKQSLGVLFICALIDLLPGYFLGALEVYLISIPGLLVILPATIGLRGNTFGALASRLSSKLHLGLIEPKFRGNRTLKDQVIATGIQLLALSTLIPIIGILIGLIFGLEFAPVTDLLFISLMAGLISGILMMAISLGITFLSFRNGWDPDNISAPIIASSGDILTIPILFFAAWISRHVSHFWINWTSVTMVVLIVISIIILLSRYRKEIREILVGMFPIAFVAIVISTFAGLVLGAAFDSYLKGTLFLLLVPAFNGQGGSIGSILGSRLTSASYLGQDRLTMLPNKTGRRSSRTLWLISLLVFSLMGIGASGIGLLAGIDIPNFLELGAILLFGASLITLISSAIAYYVAFISFKMGLDPDNVVIPILTAVMDVVGSGSLVVSILLISSVL
jgi:mgtE-like transporter